MELHLTCIPLLKEMLYSITVAELLATTFLSLLVLSSIQNRPLVKAPFAGYRSWLEPTFLVRLRFLTNARDILTSGYQKVRNQLCKGKRYLTVSSTRMGFSTSEESMVIP